MLFRSTPDCQQKFREINLHWHDLRHEYASRLVERGVPLAQVRDLLGHASITTTERYDNQKLENLQTAVLKLEDGKTFDPNAPIPARGNSRGAKVHQDDADKVSSFFQDQAKVPRNARQKRNLKIKRKPAMKKDLADWLGGRDSNPDTVVQSHVSYRWTTSQLGLARNSEFRMKNSESRKARNFHYIGASGVQQATAAVSLTFLGRSVAQR